MSPPSVPIPWPDRFLAFWRRRGWRGFTRLHNFFKPAPGRREILATTRYGTRFLLSPYDVVDHHVIMEGFYESEVLEALRPALATPGAVLWIVGANFGLHAVTAKALHPQARVIAFEPYPRMADRLLENSRLNGVEIELHRCALAGREGVLPFYANASGNPGMSTLRPVGGVPYELRFDVPAATAAGLIESGAAPVPDVLLVDAEGAEAEILAGFGRHLADPRLRLFVFEAPNEFLASRAPADLHAVVADAGFAVEVLTRREDTAHSCSNFVARRRTPSPGL